MPRSNREATPLSFEASPRLGFTRASLPSWPGSIAERFISLTQARRPCLPAQQLAYFHPHRTLCPAVRLVVDKPAGPRTGCHHREGTSRRTTSPPRNAARSRTTQSTYATSPRPWVHLAVKGYLTIEHQDANPQLGIVGDYIFHLKEAARRLERSKPHEQQMLRGIFVPGNPALMMMATLQQVVKNLPLSPALLARTNAMTMETRTQRLPRVFRGA